MDKIELDKLKIRLFEKIYTSYDPNSNYVDMIIVKQSCTTYKEMEEFSEVQQ